jgi:hypothetical protein
MVGARPATSLRHAHRWSFAWERRTARSFTSSTLISVANCSVTT